MNIFSPWDDEQKASARRIAGLACTALTLFVFVSIVSYLFNWKQDLSLIAQSLSADDGVQAANAGGKLGVRLGHWLVCELFGLGSLGIVVVLAALSIRTLLNKWRVSLVRTVLITLFAAVIASFIFAYASRLLGWDYVFGGGMGGRCGAWMVTWAVSMIGLLMTGACLVLLVAAFLFFSSSKFNHWFGSLGTKKAKKKQEVVEEEQKAEDQEEDLAEDTVIPSETEEIDNMTVAEEDSSDAVPESTAEEDIPESGQPETEDGFEIVEAKPMETEDVEELKPIDNRLDPPEGLPYFQFPSIELLHNYNSMRHEVTTAELTRNNNKIRAALATFKIQITDVKAIVGPTVTLYKVNPADGVKIQDIRRLQDDIALRLGTTGVRVVTLSDSVGIEVPNDFASTVPLKAMLNDEAFRESKADLPVAIGYTITQKVRVFDLADAPHLLVAGATKQGKSVGLNVIVSSLLYSKHPSELKFVFIDPKMVEFSAYASLLKHYMAVMPDACDEEDELNTAIVKKPKDAEKILRSLCIEMDERYELLSKAGVNKIGLYNEKFKARKLRPDKGHKFLPFLVVVIDEYADLTMTAGATPETKQASRSIINSVIRLAQKGRAAGLHVILATQRPSVDVVSSVIKSNFPMRIAFRTSSRTDSQTIIDAPGAEKLIGRGDMLFSAGIENERIQCAYVSGEEIDSITSFISSQQGYGKSYNTAYYLPNVEDSASEGGASDPGSLDVRNMDERFAEAAKLVVSTQHGSTSDLQRKLGMGYAKAGRVMDQLEMAGIVGPQEGSKPRQVLISDFEQLQTILDLYQK